MQFIYKLSKRSIVVELVYLGQVYSLSKGWHTGKYEIIKDLKIHKFKNRKIFKELELFIEEYFIKINELKNIEEQNLISDILNKN